MSYEEIVVTASRSSGGSSRGLPGFGGGNGSSSGSGSGGSTGGSETKAQKID